MINTTTKRENARKAVSRKRNGTAERQTAWKQERKQNILDAIKFIIMVALILVGCRV